MSSEWREECCEECGATFERRWVIRTHRANTPMPKGFHVESRRKSLATIAGPTADTTLCMCDTAV